MPSSPFLLVVAAALWTGCAPWGATCEENRCDDSFAGSQLHERYTVCAECDAETDTCMHRLLGEDGKEVDSCESCLDCGGGCSSSLDEQAAIYCTGSI